MFLRAWYTLVMDSVNIQVELAQLAVGNEEYAKFNARIVNTKKQVLGVRVPDLRKIARKLAKEWGGPGIDTYLANLDKNNYEQVLLAGMLINYAKLTDMESISLAKKYLKLADSWAEIDIFASKRRQFDKDLWWNFAADSLKSKKEFIVRYGVVEMMANYLNVEYIEEVFAHLQNIKHTGYYVKMGMAWLYATAAVQFYDRTLDEIRTANIDPWTKNKALTKMLESYQFTPEQKMEIRGLRASTKRTSQQ